MYFSYRMHDYDTIIWIWYGYWYHTSTTILLLANIKIMPTTPHSSKQFSLAYTSYVDGLTIAT